MLNDWQIILLWQKQTEATLIYVLALLFWNTHSTYKNPLLTTEYRLPTWCTINKIYMIYTPNLWLYMYDILWSTYLDPCGTWWSAGFPAQCRAENSRSLGLRGTDYWAWTCHLCRLSHRRWCLPDLLTQHYYVDNIVSVAVLWAFLSLKKKKQKYHCHSY